MSYAPIMKQARVAEPRACAICAKPMVNPTKNQKVHAGACKREQKIRMLRKLRGTR